MLETSLALLNSHVAMWRYANDVSIDDISDLDCQVHRYVVLVTNAVIPKSFWGTKSNFKLVLHSNAFFVYINLNLN